MNDDLQRNLDLAAEQESKRLTTKIEQVRKFLGDCDEDQLRFLRSVFSNGVSHDAPKQELVGRKILSAPRITVPEYGPITDRGTPRQRAWGVLFPAVEQAIGTMDDITSVRVYDYLKVANFKFSTDRPVSSIAAVLRKLKADGVLRESEPWKGGSRPVVFRKVSGTKRRNAREHSNEGSLTKEVKRHISRLSGSFTTSAIVEMLRKDGYKFSAASPVVAVNGVFGRLLKGDEIRFLTKGLGKIGHLYERTAKWRD